MRSLEGVPIHHPQMDSLSLSICLTRILETLMNTRCRAFPSSSLLRRQDGLRQFQPRSRSDAPRTTQAWHRPCSKLSLLRLHWTHNLAICRLQPTRSLRLRSRPSRVCRPVPRTDHYPLTWRTARRWARVMRHLTRSPCHSRRSKIPRSMFHAYTTSANWLSPMRRCSPKPSPSRASTRLWWTSFWVRCKSRKIRSFQSWRGHRSMLSHTISRTRQRPGRRHYLPMYSNR